jgi:hypothetical protein
MKTIEYGGKEMNRGGPAKVWWRVGDFWNKHVDVTQPWLHTYTCRDRGSAD